MSKGTASTVATEYADFGDRTLAYRVLGEGHPLILALRFRGVMDSWDPLFLDELATSFKVVIFDYSGLGASTGTATYDRATLAKDAKDLIDYLGFKKVAIGGWSLGGVVAQTFTLAYPELVSHTVLIGTAPPGHQKIAGEPLFIKTAMNPVNTLEDEFVLFFDPTSQRSNLAARRSHERIAQRTTALSPPIPVETFMKLLGQAKDPSTIYPDPDGSHSAWLASGACPILVISGDRDIACPVENWLELVKDWKSLYVVTVPQAGHAPHHQEPEFCAETIKTFVTKIR